MDIITQSNFDRFCKQCYGSCIGFSVVLMMISTCALIGNSVPIFGNITRMNEIVYGQCIANIKYENYHGETFNTVLPIKCPEDMENFQHIVMLSYSIWDNSRVSMGWPWIPYHQAIGLYKCGLFVLFVSVPYYIYLHHVTREDT